jgi:hypothetical protein
MWWTYVLYGLIAYLVFAIFVKPLYYRWFYKRQGIPFYPFVPVVGNMVQLSRDFQKVGVEKVRSAFDLIAAERPDADFVGFFLNTTPVLMPVNPAIVCQICTKVRRYHKRAAVTNLIKPFGVGGVLNGEDDEWSKARKAVAPSF